MNGLPHHDDVPGYTWSYGIYGAEPAPKNPFWQALGFAASALIAMSILGLGYGLVIWGIVTLGNETDLWDVDLNILVAFGFGILLYWMITIIAAHKKAMFSDQR